MALLSKTPRKQAPLNIYLRVLTIRIHPKPQAFMRVSGVLQGRLIKSSFLEMSAEKLILTIQEINEAVQTRLMLFKKLSKTMLNSCW
jgi:hypothetical protein